MPRSQQLTKRQAEILRYIRQMIDRRGFAPSIREIGERFEISSPNGVTGHLYALEQKGAIKRATGLARSIQLTRRAKQLSTGLPLAGKVAAGPLAEAIAQEETIDFQKWFEQPGTFVLEVTGDSMIDAHIDDGDYVVVDPHRSPRKGNIVVLQTDEGEATLKYWYPERGRVRLQPANRRMRAIYIRQPHVLGVVIAVMRKCG